jgi:hypothetical protein
MHDAEIASRKETVMKGSWKRFKQSQKDKTNETAVVSRERKLENQKKSPPCRKCNTCTSFSLCSAVKSHWHMHELQNLFATHLYITTQPMQPFFFFGSSSSLSKSGTRGVGLCGVVMSFSDVELVVGKTGRVAMVGVIRYPPLVPGRGLVGSFAASDPRGHAEPSWELEEFGDFVGEPGLGLWRGGCSKPGCWAICCCGLSPEL